MKLAADLKANGGSVLTVLASIWVDVHVNVCGLVSSMCHHYTTEYTCGWWVLEMEHLLWRFILCVIFNTFDAVEAELSLDRFIQFPMS